MDAKDQALGEKWLLTYNGMRDRAEKAEAAVRRLRGALTILRIGATGHDRIGIDEALAATEPTP